MACCHLFLLLSVISMSNLTRHVSALSPEYIMNGRLIDQGNYSYQAAIFGRENPDATNRLRCNGAVVAPHWILSVAHCFMLTSEILKSLIFTVIVGSSDITSLNDPGGVMENLLLIYTYYYEADRSNDIAMINTQDSLIQENRIGSIGISQDSKSFLGEDGVVSGYGCPEYKRMLDVEGHEFFVRKDTDMKLRYTTVKVLENSECAEEFVPYISVENKFCGKAHYMDGKYTGFCWNDAGSPLVIDDKVVAIASTGHTNCDDTIHGSVYTDVSEYYQFIANVMSNTTMDGVVERHLRKA